MLAGKRILLIIGGGIAAYKSLDLIRRLRERGAIVRVVMTEAAQAFVTPLSVGTLTGEDPFIDLFDRAREHDVGHIRLAREADVIVAAPATADLLAKMANGLASDLATAILLAADKPVLVAPAMNPAMWAHAATRRNVATLTRDGVHFVGPEVGEMAEAGEAGLGRMAEPMAIVAAAERLLSPAGALGPLAGQRVLVTAGPTQEPLDPVRHLSNRSSGKQGYAIARAAAAAGADTVLVSGPVQLVDPPGIKVARVETAAEMLAAVEAALPVDAAIMAAAVSDWRPAAMQPTKMKKGGEAELHLDLVANPDILAFVSQHPTMRPRLVIGFAAETDDVAENARAKLRAKRCDWIVANDVSRSAGAVGSDYNAVKLISTDGVEEWPRLLKSEIADRLVARIAGSRLAKAAE
jgi:phosphopantothenoylcysteine decarboxylase/phosphopantothenate--cysteine ligase